MMEIAQDIGGVFSRLKAPQALESWKHAHLGVDISQGVWIARAGPAVAAPFAADTDYCGASCQTLTLNFRVGDKDAPMWQLTTAGIDVITKPELSTETGRFGRIHDLEGNQVEPWEPTALTALPPEQG